MKRRDFVTLVGGAAATWPLAARAQQAAMPLIGYLSSFPANVSQKYMQAFREGLTDAGFAEGRNVTIEYRWAEGGQYGRLPAMAADLIDRGAAAVFATPIAAALAANAATRTTPIVFAIGSDPVKMGLAASLNRPGGNCTGATFLSVDLTAKRLELLRQLVPKIGSVGLLVNPDNPTTATQTQDMQAAASSLGLQVKTVTADTQVKIDDAFAALAAQHADALVVGADPVFMANRDQVARLAARYAIPSMYFAREFPIAGGLISYASDNADAVRKASTYVARILKGEKPADLPVLQPTKFELVINLKAAKNLGISVPQSLAVAADEVIE